MVSTRSLTRLALVGCSLLLGSSASGADQNSGSEADRLVAAMLGETPIIEDLRSLTDEIGGRPTASPANVASVAWGLERFREAGVDARSEAFEMPKLWLERGASATIQSATGDIAFSPRVAAMPFSTAAEGATGPLINAGRGTEGDFARLTDRAGGAFLLIATDELEDIAGLFKEYGDAYLIEGRAIAAGAAGVVYVGSRPDSLLYRHNASRGPENDRPMLVMERDAGLRAQRLLSAGHELKIELTIDLETGPAYDSHNVIAEIKGTAQPEEFVVIGAHLDSWGLGTGALDNGCNVALVIDIARQIKRLGLAPRRTIRFALWNGEEEGLQGSRGYTESHEDELDRHVMASSFDIGSGRIEGFFTNGRGELIPVLEKALEPVAGLGPFTHINAPIVGTDNYDFMMQGVGNLVANQASANYGPNYHARSDTFDKVDQRQLKLNSAIAAAVVWGYANQEVSYGRLDRAAVEHLIETSDLPDQMKMFGVWDAWADGSRGRADD